jgi:hypothetical protein
MRSGRRAFVYRSISAKQAVRMAARIQALAWRDRERMKATRAEHPLLERVQSPRSTNS